MSLANEMREKAKKANLDEEKYAKQLAINYFNTCVKTRIEEAAAEVQKSSRHYAKRQLTWFRRNKAVHWLTRKNGESGEEILEKARQVVQESDN